MYIHFVKFESELPEADVIATAKERSDDYRALPGLVQKYYVKFDEPNHYGAVYVWDSPESLAAFRKSALVAGIPEAYAIAGAPTFETGEMLMQLRDAA